MKRYSVKVNEKELEVELTKRDGCTVNFVVDGEQYQVDVAPMIDEGRVNQSTPQIPQTNRTIPRAASAPKNSSKSSNQNATIAPMPGIVVSILAKEGAQVEVGTTVLVMEAMKMENNISAHRSGTVRKVLVKVGQEVENGQALIEIV